VTESYADGYIPLSSEPASYAASSNREYFEVLLANLMNAIVSSSPGHRITAHRSCPLKTNSKPNSIDSGHDNCGPQTLMQVDDARTCRSATTRDAGGDGGGKQSRHRAFD
jgi:hypothetical protein